MANEELQQVIALLEEKLAQCQSKLKRYENRENYSIVVELEQEKKSLAAQLRKKEKDWQQQVTHYKQTIHALKVERRKKLTQISSLLAEKNKLRAQLAATKNQLQQANTTKPSTTEQRLIPLFEQLAEATMKLEHVAAALQQQLENEQPEKQGSTSFSEPLTALEHHMQDLFSQSVIVEKQLQAKLALLHELEQQLYLLSEGLEEEW
ncbi:hypothetical protein [Metasolibacillus meyeri]|uniref:hypothetical protein n=1 Tax=Metasolibacillus meyeri TaxID=1071052 RepID=UPI000D30FEDA|nr:hypothetical protein [Metasolibacillus meyeri]